MGDVFQITVERRYYYGQVLTRGVCAFFDWQSTCPVQDLSRLSVCPVLFTVCVYPRAFSGGDWTIVGKMPVREGLLPLPMEYIHHKYGSPEFELYDPNSGEIRKATKEECRGLESAAVWEAHHVEDRLEDYYAGRPCVWLKEAEELF